jgi:hypothetical protein
MGEMPVWWPAPLAIPKLKGAWTGPSPGPSQGISRYPFIKQRLKGIGRVNSGVQKRTLIPFPWGCSYGDRIVCRWLY